MVVYSNQHSPDSVTLPKTVMVLVEAGTVLARSVLHTQGASAVGYACDIVLATAACIEVAAVERQRTNEMNRHHAR